MHLAIDLRLVNIDISTNKYAAQVYSTHKNAGMRCMAEDLRRGDTVTVFGSGYSKIGQLIGIKLDKISHILFLQTDSGIEKVSVGAQDALHVVRAAINTEIKEHSDYERSLQATPEVKKPFTTPDNFNKYPHTTQDDKNVDGDKKSQFPASKKMSSDLSLDLDCNLSLE